MNNRYLYLIAFLIAVPFTIDEAFCGDKEECEEALRDLFSHGANLNMLNVADHCTDRGTHIDSTKSCFSETKGNIISFLKENRCDQNVTALERKKADQRRCTAECDENIGKRNNKDVKKILFTVQQSKKPHVDNSNWRIFNLFPE